MESCVNYLPRKSFHKFGIVLLTLFGLFAIVVISISSSFDFNTSFRCYSKTKDPSFTKYINIRCSLEYEQKFLFVLPISIMFMLNFGIVMALSLVYAYMVKHRVERYDYSVGTASSNDNDGADQVMLTSPIPYEIPRVARGCLVNISTFTIYITYLVVIRIIPLLLFALVFYRAHIPNNFPCPWQHKMQGENTPNLNDTLKSKYILTIVDCTNLIGGKSKTFVDAVATVDVFVVILTFLELGYIAWLVYNDRTFMTEQEFCAVYLLRKRKTIRKFLKKIREKVSCDSVEDIYVNLVIQEGRERLDAYPQEFKRHEIYQSHLETPSTVTKLSNVTDIFKPQKGQVNPRSILVIGRPGIGKTMLTRELLYQWKVKGDEFWHGKIVIRLEFHQLLHEFQNKNISLLDMLRFGLPKSDGFETVFNFILSNPDKVVLIFDGLDEFTVDSVVFWKETETVSAFRKMHVFSIFKILVAGRLLPGVTILTTSRSTAPFLFRNLNFQKMVEILGFSENEIQEYVYKFCMNVYTSELIWIQIKGSAELLSLCYMPVISYIVCLVLKESIENDETGEQFYGVHRNIPKTITELYKIAVRELLYRHHPRYKLQPRPNGYLIIPFPKELENDLMKLKELATRGIIEHRLIFEINAANELINLANCGFFHKLPDKRQNLFCFLHLTLQEFLAASKVVDDMDNVERFLVHCIDDPNWHLVIQFVAGLVGDEIRKAKMADEGVTNDPKESKRQEIHAAILKRLEEWAFLLGTTNEIALLAIKCLYELQNTDIMKSVSSKFLAEGDGKLFLSNLNIAAVDSRALFTFLGNSKNLKQLAFSGCTIQDNCNYRFKSLLNIAGNTITSFWWTAGGLADVAVEYLSEALKSENCKVTKLDLGHNKITDLGVEYLSEALKSENCKLTELDLGDNEITDQGVEYLSEALKSENCKLTKLDLGDNEITDQGVDYLSEALKSDNCKLTKLDLGSNERTDQGFEQLSEALKGKDCEPLKMIYLNPCEN